MDVNMAAATVESKAGKTASTMVERWDYVWVGNLVEKLDVLKVVCLVADWVD